MEDIPARVFSCDTTFAFDIRPYAINFYEVKALNDNHQCSYEDVEHSPEENDGIDNIDYKYSKAT